MKRIDLTGRKFGRWTVVEYVGLITGGSSWRCLCECGSISTISSGNLRNGISTSCGCRKRESINMTGLRYGRLLVVKRAGYLYDRPAWECVCDCGNTVIRPGDALRSGNTKSCGCLHTDSLEKRWNSQTTHGLSKQPWFKVWKEMMRRCYSEKSHAFKDYGGRGIIVCERWHSPENFGLDMGNPTGRLTLERANVNGNYEPGNCKWETYTTQARNRRNNREISAFGQTKLLIEWAEDTGLKPETISQRIKRGWTAEKALTTNPDRKAV